jgi:hypothetical protein
MSSHDQRTWLLERVRAVPSATRVQRRARALVAGAASAIVTISLFLVFGGIRPGGTQAGGLSVARPLELMLITAAGAAVIAACGWWALVSRGRSMLGRKASRLAVAGAGIAVLLFAWKVAASSAFSGMSAAWPSRPGLRCAGLGMLLGLWPLAALLVARHRSDATHPDATGAAFGIAAGASTWVLMDLWCPVAHPQHLLLGHLLPIAALAALGAWAGHRWLGLKIALPRGRERNSSHPSP